MFLTAQGGDNVKKIMVADEEPRLRMLYEEILSGLGYEVYFGVNSTEAWEMFREYRPDLVILDLDMSDGRSLQILRRMRRLDSAVPILATSIDPAACGNPDLAKIGVAAVLTKPIDIGILRLRLETTLKVRRGDIQHCKSS
jgi:DNA-binding response OmpR family regulator